MFGSKPYDDQFRPMPDPQENTRFILDKISELEKRLTKQMTCDHPEFNYTFRLMAYDKECKQCGLYMGAVHPKEKAEEELSAAKAKVARMEAATKKPDHDLRQDLKALLDKHKEIYNNRQRCEDHTLLKKKYYMALTQEIYELLDQTKAG